MRKSAKPGKKARSAGKKSSADYFKKIETLNESIDNQIDRISKRNNIPENIFHYTDVSGLFSILSNNTIRLSHLYYLNDSKEYKYGLEIVNRVIDEALSDSSVHPKIRLFLSEYQSFRQGMPLGSYCVACFSGTGDKLSQWRAYAGNGAGYSIGFKSQNLNDASRWSLVRVVYDLEEQVKIIRYVIDNYTEHAKANLDFTESESDKDKVITTFIAFALRLDSEVVRFKHPGFQEEDEYRLVLSNDMSGFLFRPARDMMIPYLDLPGWNDSLRNHLPICEIVIGPTNKYERFLVINSLTALLKSKGYNIDASDIKQSGIPYRI